MTVVVFLRAALGADERGSGPTSLEALQAATGEYASFPAYRAPAFDFVTHQGSMPAKRVLREKA